MAALLPGWVLPVLFAPFAGSFVGVLIRRLPEGGAVVWARSACAECGARLGPADLVPIASYALQRGCCRHCARPFGPFHLFVELAAVLVAISAALVVADPPLLWADCLLGWALLAAGWIDTETMRLPDVLTLPLLLAGLASTALLQPASLAGHAMGAAAGYLTFRLIGTLYRVWRGREGMGEGDAKLLAAAGAWMGWRALPDVVLAAALLALGYVLIVRLRGRAMDAGTAIAFGPFLALALWLVRLIST